MEKKVFTIDGNNFNNLESFYEEISNKLIPNIYWGKNLDAFNDILFGGFGDIDDGEDYILVWKNSKKSKEDLSYPETILQLQKRLTRCHTSNKLDVEEEINKAKQKEGNTVFDWLIDIIKDNENVSLILE